MGRGQINKAFFSYQYRNCLSTCLWLVATETQHTTHNGWRVLQQSKELIQGLSSVSGFCEFAEQLVCCSAARDVCPMHGAHVLVACGLPCSTIGHKIQRMACRKGSSNRPTVRLGVYNHAS